MNYLDIVVGRRCSIPRCFFFCVGWVRILIKREITSLGSLDVGRETVAFAIKSAIPLVVSGGLWYPRRVDALPADMRARFARICQLIATIGLERVGAPYVRHLTGPLWEMGIARALYVICCGGPLGCKMRWSRIEQA